MKRRMKAERKAEEKAAKAAVEGETNEAKPKKVYIHYFI